MPTFRSFAEFGQALDKMANEIERSAKAKITRDMAQRAAKIAESAASADLGGDPKFSHWKPMLDTQIKAGRDGSSILMPTRSGAGPWTVAQFGRHQGNAGGFAGPGINRKSGNTSRTKSGGLRKVRSVKGKRWNGTTDPKHTADKAVRRMEAELPKIAEDGIRRVMQRHFDVD